ncbi:hypothetical protein N9C31_01635 [Gammaproteobacteria bacterium]|nr:hypothetical protein [Gammaproteobacteria bacterium]
MTSTNFNLCIPSKTFFLGEYSVLTKNRAVVLAHAPYFQCVSSQDSTWPPHPAIQDHPEVTQSFGLIDPHQGKGGFGASSALILALAHHIRPFDIKFAHTLNAKYSPHSSGADVLSQYFGHLSLINTSTCSAKPIHLHPSCAITLLRTPVKVSTHEHLKTPLQYDACHLDALVNDFLQQPNDLQHSARIINEYEQALQLYGLRHPSTYSHVQMIRSIANVLAVKGCGALGADVLLVLSHQDHQAKIITQLPQAFTVIATEQDIAKGLL